MIFPNTWFPLGGGNHYRSPQPPPPEKRTTYISVKEQPEHYAKAVLSFPHKVQEPYSHSKHMYSNSYRITTIQSNQKERRNFTLMTENPLHNFCKPGVPEQGSSAVRVIYFGLFTVSGLPKVGCRKCHFYSTTLSAFFFDPLQEKHF